MNIRLQIAENLKMFRKAKNLTQREAADKIGTKQSTLASWESGKSQPDAETFLALCSLYDISLSDIIPEPRKDAALTSRELDLVRMYRTLEVRDREIVFDVLYAVFERTKKERAEYIYDPPPGYLSVTMTDEQGRHVQRKLTLEEYEMLEKYLPQPSHDDEFESGQNLDVAHSG